MMEQLFDPTRLIFIHGMVSSSQGFKAKMLRELFPDMLIPDFTGSLEERMRRLTPILSGKSGWTVIGSSLGGLMAAIFTCSHQTQVRKLILVAPALIWPGFIQLSPEPVDVPTVIYHGTRDTIIPLEMLRPIAERTFTNLIFHIVDDDHGLRKTAQDIDWRELLT